jgi:deazaflavin-dependent oxidoreductase (nitroreductase family)
MVDVNDWNAGIIEEFRRNEGQVSGTFEGATMLLLHTTGARTGRERVNPLVYLPDGDRYVVFASKGGAPTHPDWYRNLLANPDVTVEVGTQTIPVRATVVTGPERDALFAKQVERRSSFGDYARKTDRVIPAIALEPVA